MPRNPMRLSRIPGIHTSRGRALLLVTGVAGVLLIIAGLLSPPVPALSQAQFADQAFRALWERTDAPVASGSVQRGWVWGPVAGQSLTETFQGITGNSHLVQYFDKGRMEINNPGGNRKDPFFVTNGLLAVELISGQQQTGISSYQYRGPASIDMASDVDDPSAPTYQSFNGVASIPGAPNERKALAATGAPVRTAIDRQGRTQPWPEDHPDYGVRIAYFEPITAHNVPDVFWDYLNGQGTIIQDGQTVRGPLFYPWMSVTGYPISEPYWSYVKVEGKYTDVLIQAFERRVLTYVPHFQPGYKVQMGNIGQHYSDWRYRGGGGTGGPGPATPTPNALPPKAAIQLSDIGYPKSIVDINGSQVRITNSGQSPVTFDGYWLDSPKWDHVDRFFFPKGITLAPGASMVAHAGRGVNSATDIYMSRTTVMWDRQAYDLAVLYDNYGREVTRFFPAGETGPPPPTQAVPTPTGPPAPGGATPTLVPGKTPPADQTATPTQVVPTPVPTQGTELPTPTSTPKP